MGGELTAGCVGEYGVVVAVYDFDHCFRDDWGWSCAGIVDELFEGGGGFWG